MTQAAYTIQWSPTIGDPTLTGWLTVACYFYAAWVAYCVAADGKNLFDHEAIKQRVLWQLITIFLLFLGVNKQLDLQTLATEIAKYYAHHDGWYKSRHIYQRLFIVTIASASLTLCVALLYLFRKVVTSQLLAITGVCVLIFFILTRASSIHQVDQLISVSLYGLRMNFIMEVSGIALIVVGGLRLLKRNQQE